eukprot:gene12713-biopygen1935
MRGAGTGATIAAAARATAGAEQWREVACGAAGPHRGARDSLQLAAAARSAQCPVRHHGHGATVRPAGRRRGRRGGGRQRRRRVEVAAELSAGD